MAAVWLQSVQQLQQGLKSKDRHHAILSRKHKENELRGITKAKPRTEAAQASEEPSTAEPVAGPSSQPTSEDPSVVQVTSQVRGVALRVDEDATEEEINQTIDEKIAAARARPCPLPSQDRITSRGKQTGRGPALAAPRRHHAGARRPPGGLGPRRLLIARFELPGLSCA